MRPALSARPLELPLKNYGVCVSPLSLYKGSYALGPRGSHRVGVASCTPGEGRWLVSHGQSILFSRLWRQQRGSQAEQRGGREHCPGALVEGGQVPAPCAQAQHPGWEKTCPACSRGPSRGSGGGDSSRGDGAGGLQHLRHLEKLIERGSLNTKKTVQRGPPSTCKGVAAWGAQARTSLPSSPWEASALCWRRPGQRRPESPRPSTCANLGVWASPRPQGTLLTPLSMQSSPCV